MSLLSTLKDGIFQDKTSETHVKVLLSCYSGQVNGTKIDGLVVIGLAALSQITFLVFSDNSTQFML